MTYQQLQEKIVSRFWSEALKAQITRTNHQFSPKDLMGMIWKQTESMQERHELLRELAALCPELREHIGLVLAWEERNLSQFKELAPGEVFELQINDEPDEDAERILCADFDACLAMIDRYFAKYDWVKETSKTRYSIERRRLHTAADDLELSPSSCDLLPGKEVSRIWFGSSGEFADCGDCVDCERRCIDSLEPEIPEFLPNLSPVRYLLQDQVCFGCSIALRTAGWEGYIIPLDSPMFDEPLDDFLDHEHIPYPDIEPASIEDLPEPLRRNYKTLTTWWRAQNYQ